MNYVCRYVDPGELEVVRRMIDMKNASQEQLLMRKDQLPKHLGNDKFWVSWNSMVEKPDWKKEMQYRSMQNYAWEKENFLSNQQVRTLQNMMNSNRASNAAHPSAPSNTWM